MLDSAVWPGKNNTTGIQYEGLEAIKEIGHVSTRAHIFEKAANILIVGKHPFLT
jgi:hypothetical protein